MQFSTIKRILASFTMSACLFSSVASAGVITFTDPNVLDSFVVPFGVTEIRVLTIGGGGGGTNGHQGGGGAGYLATATFSVTDSDIFSISVGAGGNGALAGSNTIIGSTVGGTSSFDIMFSLGGGIVTGINQGGHNGSSGGGGACNSGSIGGAGGSGGSNGQPCVSGSSMPIGLGQGDYSGLLSIFTQGVISAGAGGAGGTGSHAGGGGGGGVLINSVGISAANGAEAWSGKGGLGYGAGGGAGGFDGTISVTRIAGGDGASGLVYVEWDSVTNVPAPSTFLILALGLMGVGLRRSRN